MKRRSVTFNLNEFSNYLTKKGENLNSVNAIENFLEQHEKFRLEPVSFLMGKKFLVENYQRGYRWTKIEVNDLLDDINEFSTEGKEFYCLQPVVVKYNEAEKSWELIDGQQRVTTIYLILRYLDIKLTLKECGISITYRTRNDQSDTFLENKLDCIKPNDEWDDYLKNNSKLDTIDTIDTIDNYHFFHAWKTITNWFNKNKKDQKEVEKFKNTLLEKVKLIWYNASENEQKKDAKESLKNTKESLKDSIAVFSRLNSRKIPLQNSELIKATFLSLIPYEKQLKLVQEWDEIEHAFFRDNSELWYFINPKGSETDSNRIDFLFDIISKKNKNLDTYHSNRYYQVKLKNNLSDKEKFVETEWKKIRTLFFKIEEWYEDQKLYHYIGYLITTGYDSVQELSKNEPGKKGFLLQVTGKIRQGLQNDIKKINGKLENENKKDWSELDYRVKSEYNVISKILLLFNIQTIVSTTNDKSLKFPFNTYAGEIWSLEHIHAQNSENDKRLKELEKNGDWLKNIQEVLKNKKKWKNEKNQEFLDALIQSIDSALAVTNLEKTANFEKLIQDIDSFFSGAIDENELHIISNMALLEKDMNSSLSNSYFGEKRKKIIKYDKEGKFIPIATKNVFSKHYSDLIEDFDIWSPEDRSAYLNEINDLLGDTFITKLKLGESNESN